MVLKGCLHIFPKFKFNILTLNLFSNVSHVKWSPRLALSMKFAVDTCCLHDLGIYKPWSGITITESVPPVNKLINLILRHRANLSKFFSKFDLHFLLSLNAPHRAQQILKKPSYTWIKLKKVLLILIIQKFKFWPSANGGRGSWLQCQPKHRVLY